MSSLPLRKETDPKYHWHLEDIFTSPDEWEETFTYVSEQLPEMEALQGTLGQSADALYGALTKLDEVSLAFYKVYAYASMKTDEDTTDSESQARSDRAKSLLVRLQAAVAFVEPELLAVPEETIKGFMEQKSELKLYQQYFDNLWRQKEHVLSPAEEQILAQAGQVTRAPHSIYTMLNNADLTFPEIIDEDGKTVQITHGRFIPLMQSKDRRVRKDAFEGLYSTYDKVKHTATALLSAQVNSNTFKARVRKFKSAREAALSANNIPESVYDSLIDAVHLKLPAMHRYVSLRKKMLGLDEIHMYDVYVPIVDDVEFKFTFEEAKEIVAESLKPLGEDYCKNLIAGMDGGWVDVYENKGKRSGAYSNSVYGVHPYVCSITKRPQLAIYTSSRDGPCHSYYTDTTQPFVYSDYSIFVASCLPVNKRAFTTSRKIQDQKRTDVPLEPILRSSGHGLQTDHVCRVREADPRTRRVRPALTVDYLRSTYKDLNVVLRTGDGCRHEISLEWARIPHFYLNFYVYQYATGYSSAVALAMNILKEGTPAVEGYLDFLKAGSSKYPVDILAHAGVDMSTPKPIVKALEVFEQTLDELEDLAFSE